MQYKKRIVEMFESGMIIGLIAKELKLKKAEVQEVLDKHGASGMRERFARKRGIVKVKKVKYATEKISLGDSKNTVIEVRRSLGVRKKREIVERYKQALNM